MGSGKTTFGMKLAKKLNYQFVDTDKEIEELVGMSIESIFNTKGEKYFRQLEKQYIQKLKVQNVVIATGGGMPCFYDNMEYLNKIGVTVYLEYSSQELFERLKNETVNRPLLKHKSEEDLFDYIDDLLLKRERYYLQAQTIY